MIIVIISNVFINWSNPICTFTSVNTDITIRQRLLSAMGLNCLYRQYYLKEGRDAFDLALKTQN